jgi:hypothetical protein
MQIQIQYKKLWAVLAAENAKTKTAATVLVNEESFFSLWRNLKQSARTDFTTKFV